MQCEICEKNESIYINEESGELVCENCMEELKYGGDFTGAGDEDAGEIPTNDR